MNNRNFHFTTISSDFRKIEKENNLPADFMQNLQQYTAFIEKLPRHQKETILFYFAELGDQEKVKWLVEEMQVNVNAVHLDSGKNCCHLAIVSSKKCLELTTFLISKGININLLDCCNFTPLELHVRFYLFNRDSRIKANNIETIFALLNAGAEVKNSWYLICTVKTILEIETHYQQVNHPV